MTKATYFEMCEMLGEAPVEENIPIEFEDFPLELQQAVLVYSLLRDEWDPMGGSYLGKSWTGLPEVLEINEVGFEDKKLVLRLINIIDSVRQDLINSKLSAQKPAT